MRAVAELIGCEPMIAQLGNLDAKMRRKTLRRACTKAAQAISKAIKAAAPAESGALKKAIGYKVRVYKNGIRVLAIIGPRRGAVLDIVQIHGKTKGFARKAWADAAQAGRSAGQRRPANYAMLVEHGHKGPHPAPAHPFVGPAWERAKSAAQQAIRGELARASLNNQE